MKRRNNFAAKGLALGLLMVATISGGLCADGAGYNFFRLQSGKQIKLLGMAATPGEGGGARSLTLKYQTDKNLSNRKELAAEADDIWDMFKVEVEKAGLGAALISVYAQPLGGGKFGQQFDYVLVKDGAGRWQCLNDNIVGVGTPAKIAYRQGLNLMKQGRSQDALAQFDKCISLDAAYGPAYIDRMAAHLQVNQPQRAVEDANQALVLLPDNAGVYCNRGIAYWKLNQKEKALEDFTRVINLTPTDILGYMNRGAAYVEIGQYESGIADLNKAISIDPRVARPYHNRALAYEKLAERDRRSAVERGHQSVAAAGGIH